MQCKPCLGARCSLSACSVMVLILLTYPTLSRCKVGDYTLPRCKAFNQIIRFFIVDIVVIFEIPY